MSDKADLTSIRALLFDMDGTLISILHRFMYPVDKLLRSIKEDYDQPALQREFKRLLQQSGGRSSTMMFRTFNDIGKTAGLSFFQRLKMLFRAFTNKDQFRNIVLVENAPEVVNWAREHGFRLALVTSGSSSAVKKVLSRVPELAVFEVVVTRDDVTHLKPDPEPLLIAAERLGVPIEQCAMVGDFPLDVEAAKNAKCISIAILGEMAPWIRELLESSNPDFLIETIAELPGLFEHLQ